MSNDSVSTVVSSAGNGGVVNNLVQVRLVTGTPTGIQVHPKDSEATIKSKLAFKSRPKLSIVTWRLFAFSATVASELLIISMETVKFPFGLIGFGVTVPFVMTIFIAFELNDASKKADALNMVINLLFFIENPHHF